ncbi:MAG TPA: hypothetical protein VJG90_01910 [Candidatus Nanoarchaeia archaeon]|nr:hypothetical protein [Candidatus Nanoarchaeia archaeon]
MAAKKDRRHSGYVTPQAVARFKDLVKYDLFIEPFYDDWQDHRDGFRDWFRDFKMIKRIHSRKWRNSELASKRIAMNLKQKRLLKRRKARIENKPFSIPDP